MSTKESKCLPGDFTESQDQLTIPQSRAYVNHDCMKEQAKSKIIKASDGNDGMDFDELLPYVGEFGCYQKRLFALMIPFTTFLPWVYFVQIFITLVPEGHWCKIPELSNLTLEQRMALAIPPPGEYDDVGVQRYSRCSMYKVNFTEILRDGRITTANSSWPVQKCQHGWEYNFTDVPYETIATEDDWVCDRATLSFAAQSIFFVGAIVGCLIFGRIADQHGRIPALVGANMMACFAGILTTFATNFWQFAVCRFFFGLAFDNCFAMIYILVLEYVGPKWRTFVANMSIAVFFTMSSSALPWIAYYVADWRMTSLSVSVPMIITVATPWLIPESARWLASQGQVDKAIDILKKMEKVNGTHVPDNVYKEFKESCELEANAEKEGQSYSVIHLFKSPRLRRTVSLLIAIWMLISLVFDGHVRNINNLGLDIFLTFSVAAATEFPADVFLTLVLDRWGRRWIACGLMCISGVFSIWACLVSNSIYSAGLAIVGRFCMNITYNIGLQYAAELLPTVVRAQGVTLIHITGFIASIISPFIVYLAKVAPFLPLLLLGIFGLIGGVLVLSLPETLGHDLPQTLQDGEDFGKDQGFWDMPCFMKKAEDPAVTKSCRTDSLRSSGRLPLRGEILRSSIIVRSSTRSRKSPVTLPVEVSKL